MNLIKKIILSAMVVIGLVVVPTVVTTTVQAAVANEQLCKGSGGTWTGITCDNTANTGGSLESFITTVVNILLFVVGAVAVIMIIIGGIRYVVSGGDQSSVTGAKNTILYAVVGLVVAVMAYAIVNFFVSNVK